MSATVYLIHADEGIACRPNSEAQHYIGWTSRGLKLRVEDHRKGHGSPLISAWNERGIDWRVVRTWTGGRTLERNLKNRKNARALCPVCREAR